MVAVCTAQILTLDYVALVYSLRNPRIHIVASASRFPLPLLATVNPEDCNGLINGPPIEHHQARA